MNPDEHIDAYLLGKSRPGGQLARSSIREQLLDDRKYRIFKHPKPKVSNALKAATKRSAW